jgi:hypothetical protein
MSIPLFDIQASILGYAANTTESVTPDELLASAGRLGITRTLVRRAATIGGTADAMHDNEVIYAACEPNAQLVPCPAVVPNTAYDLPSEDDQIAAAIEHGAAAICIRCAHDHWFVADWVSDVLFTALSERKMPVYVDSDVLGQGALASLAGRFPDLPLIYAHISYREQRTLLPLLERFANVYVSIGNPYNVHMGVEQLAARVGAERILFGSGFPSSEQAPSVTYLMYAKLSAEEKELIGSGNMERLTGAIQS